MPKQTGKSGLAARLGDKGRKAHEAHKTDETKFSGGGDLPAGISGGIAQLKECKFGVYQSGDYTGKDYFMASGVVISPASYVDKETGNVFHVAGMRTKVGPIPLCDTPKLAKQSLDEHLADVYNELRKLGLDTADLDFDNLEAAAEALKNAQPYFTFRTWQGRPTEKYPDPRVNEDWGGVIDYTPPEDNPAAGTEDSTEAGGSGDDGGTGGEAATEAGEGDDIPALVEAANGGDDAAQQRLLALAAEAGISEHDAENAPSWEALVEAIAEVSSGEQAPEEPEAPAEEPFSPKVKEIYDYTPPKAKKPVECEVTGVDKNTSSVTLKNLATKAIYKSVKFNKDGWA